MPQASNLSGELSNVDFVDAQNGEEQTESIAVGIDMLGPACSVPRRAVADTGATGTLYFDAKDAGSSVAQATVTVVDRRGRVLRRFVERASGVDPGDELPYDYLRFKCTLKPGEYRVVVRAFDEAGNPQRLIGHGVLKVVRHGAPVFRGPGWPAGLATDYSDYAARLSHDPQARRLLRLRVSMPDGRRMLSGRWPEAALTARVAGRRSLRRPAAPPAPAGAALRRCRSGSWRRRRTRGSRRRTE